MKPGDWRQSESLCYWLLPNTVFVVLSVTDKINEEVEILVAKPSGIIQEKLYLGYILQHSRPFSCEKKKSA